jgi:hypothetical protein
MKIPRTLLLALAFLVATLTQVTLTLAADFSAIWDDSNGNWGDPLHWSSNPNYPNNGGGFTYDATINSGTVNLDRDIMIQRLFFNGGKITGASQLTLNEGLPWNSGTIALGTVGAINLAAGSTSTISNALLTSGTINNAGNVTLRQSSAIFGFSNATINNLSGANWTMQTGSELGNFGVFNNAGTFIAAKAANGNSPFMDCVFNNSGTVTLQSSNGFYLGLARGGSASGTFNVPTGFGLGFGTISNAVHPYTFTAGAAVIGGGTIVIGDSGSLIIAGDSTIQTSLVNEFQGSLTVESGSTLSLSGAFTGSGGTTRLNGGTIASVQPLDFQFGTLTGSGTITGNVNLLTGNALRFQLGGTMAGTGANNYDSIMVNGLVALGGNLRLTFKSGFENTITASDQFTVLKSSSPLSGSFANVASGSRLDTTDGFGSFIIRYAGSNVSLTNFVPNTRWLGGNGNWTNGAGWSSHPDFPNNTDSTHYSAAIHSGTVTLDADITVSRFLLTSGNLTGAHSLNIEDQFIWADGAIAGSIGSSINVGPNSVSTIAGTEFPAYHTLNGRTLNNSGIVTQGAGMIGGVINNLAGGIWYLGSSIQSATFNNAGDLIDTGSFTTGIGTLNNSGNVALRAGPVGSTITLFVENGGSATGTFDVPARTQLVLFYYTFNTGARVTGDGETLFRNVVIAGDSTISTHLTTEGTIAVAKDVTLTLGAGLSQMGILSGSGTINGNVVNSFTIAPGASAGMLTINGTVSLLNSSKIVMEIGGLTQGTQYDYLAINGMVGLDGTLELHMLNGFQLELEPGQIFTLLTSNSLLTGVFDNIASGARLTTADGLASFQVNYGAGSKYGANNLVLSDPRAVPEPASIVLLAGGALALSLFRARRR